MPSERFIRTHTSPYMFFLFRTTHSCSKMHLAFFPPKYFITFHSLLHQLQPKSKPKTGSPSVKRVSIHVKTKASYKRTAQCWDLKSNKEKEWGRHFVPIMCLGNSPHNSPYPNTQRRQARQLILKCKLIVKISGQLRDISNLKETKTANPEENSSFYCLPSETSEKVAHLGPSLGFLKFTMQIFS